MPECFPEDAEAVLIHTPCVFKRNWTKKAERPVYLLKVAAKNVHVFCKVRV